MEIPTHLRDHRLIEISSLSGDNLDLLVKRVRGLVDQIDAYHIRNSRGLVDQIDATHQPAHRKSDGDPEGDGAPRAESSGLEVGEDVMEDTGESHR